jgi:hypothetical protein
MAEQATDQPKQAGQQQVIVSAQADTANSARPAKQSCPDPIQRYVSPRARKKQDTALPDEGPAMSRIHDEDEWDLSADSYFLGRRAKKGTSQYYREISKVLPRAGSKSVITVKEEVSNESHKVAEIKQDNPDSDDSSEKSEKDRDVSEESSDDDKKSCSDSDCSLFDSFEELDEQESPSSQFTLAPHSGKERDSSSTSNDVPKQCRTSASTGSFQTVEAVSTTANSKQVKVKQDSSDSSGLTGLSSLEYSVPSSPHNREVKQGQQEKQKQVKDTRKVNHNTHKDKKNDKKNNVKKDKGSLASLREPNRLKNVKATDASFKSSNESKSSSKSNASSASETSDTSDTSGTSPSETSASSSRSDSNSSSSRSRSPVRLGRIRDAEMNQRSKEKPKEKPKEAKQDASGDRMRSHGRKIRLVAPLTSSDTSKSSVTEPSKIPARYKRGGAKGARGREISSSDTSSQLTAREGVERGVADGRNKDQNKDKGRVLSKPSSYYQRVSVKSKDVNLKQKGKTKDIDDRGCERKFEVTLRSKCGHPWECRICTKEAFAINCKKGAILNLRCGKTYFFRVCQRPVVPFNCNPCNPCGSCNPCLRGNDAREASTCERENPNKFLHLFFFTTDPVGGCVDKLCFSPDPVGNGTVCLKITNRTPKLFYYQCYRHPFEGGIIIVHGK